MTDNVIGMWLGGREVGRSGCLDVGCRMTDVGLAEGVRNYELEAGRIGS